MKPYWTEPLVTIAKLPSSMGIVKMNVLETKLVRPYQVSRLRVTTRIAVVGKQVHGVRERACGSKRVCQRAKICALNRSRPRPETEGQESTVMRVAC
jgi:hypothetical protein